ncbi:hypothetical protein DMR_10210 [Solidesulfovibrio magneticus RS-1]|uniref:Uncharacterized protein n=1 Tax=Solidesulfovibrio magneticus (strain ATCC 700980 / DSM 13731 / RS-1) TaxID=573370 RepID=C4XKX3_SOLM1|nr:hypothetical protein DMR_10210 [Solidesulfovibrio magneticus RS-1]
MSIDLRLDGLCSFQIINFKNSKFNGDHFWLLSVSENCLGVIWTFSLGLSFSFHYSKLIMNYLSSCLLFLHQ